MTERLPRVSAAEAVRVLEKAGFFLARQSGVLDMSTAGRVRIKKWK